MKKLYARLFENSVVVPGPTTEALSAVAAEYRLTLVVGICERVEEGLGRGTLYSSMLTFNPTGELINHHRKLLHLQRTIDRWAGRWAWSAFG